MSLRFTYLLTVRKILEKNIRNLCGQICIYDNVLCTAKILEGLMRDEREMRRGILFTVFLRGIAAE